MTILASKFVAFLSLMFMTVGTIFCLTDDFEGGMFLLVLSLLFRIDYLIQKFSEFEERFEFEVDLAETDACTKNVNCRKTLRRENPVPLALRRTKSKA